MNVGWKIGRRFALFGAIATGVAALPALAAVPEPIKVDKTQQLVDYIHEQLTFMVNSFHADNNCRTVRKCIEIHVGRFLDSLPKDRVLEARVICNEYNNSEWNFHWESGSIRVDVSFRLPENGTQYVFMYDTRDFA